MKLTQVLMLSAALAIIPVSQGSAGIIDFSNGMPANSSRISPNLIWVGDYQFASTNGIAVHPMGHLGNVILGYGLAAPRLSTIDISRTDGHTFDFDGFTAFVGGILVGGPADFEITPFDANGNELNPYVFRAGQFWTTYTRNGQALTGDNYAAYMGSVFGPFQNVSMLKIGAGVDDFISFNLSSVFDAPAQVPLPGAAWLFLGGLMSVLGLRKKAKA